MILIIYGWQAWIQFYCSEGIILSFSVVRCTEVEFSIRLDRCEEGAQYGMPNQFGINPTIEASKLKLYNIAYLIYFLDFLNIISLRTNKACSRRNVPARYDEKMSN
jgi:hypothetical protein